MTFEILPMTSEDLDEVIEVQLKTFIPELCEGRAVLMNRFETFGQYFTITKANNKILGYTLVFPWVSGDSPENNQKFPTSLPDPDCFFIHEITLLPEARGNGMARTMIEKASDTGRALGFKTLTLVAVTQSGDYWDKNNFKEVLDISAEKKNNIIENYGKGSRLMMRPL